MSDRAAKWQQDFKNTRAVSAQLHAELQKWELLASQTAPQRAERAKQGARVRAKVMQQKLELERLQRELDSLSDKPAEHEVTRKSITQSRDELAQALAELQELQRRAKGSPGGPSISGASSPAPSTASWETVSLASFSRLAGDSEPQPPSGAEMRPVTHRTMMEQQQQAMRDLEEPLSVIEGSVNNLQQVSTMILGEIRSQNRMLDSVNDDTDRVQSRLGRARTLLARFSREDRSRWLLCSVALLLVVLIALFVYVVGT